MAVRVLIGEDSYLVQEALRQVLADAPDVALIGVCADFDSLLNTAQAEEPDVVLTDIRMPPERTDEGIQIASRLGETNPNVGVIALSHYVDPAYVMKLLRDGCARRGYLLKERLGSRAELVGAIEEVAGGGCVIDPKVVEALVAARAKEDDSPLGGLTAREREVLTELAHGKSNAAIARTLFLTKGAVEKHINSIFSKLGLPDDSEVNRRVKATLLFLAEPDAG